MSHPFLGPMGAVPPSPTALCMESPLQALQPLLLLWPPWLCFWELRGKTFPFTCIQMFIEHLLRHASCPTLFWALGTPW